MKESYKVIKEIIPKNLVDFIYQYIMNKRKVTEKLFPILTI